MPIRKYPIMALMVTTIIALGGNATYGCPACETFAVIKQAELARSKAASVGGEWLNTEDMIQAAKSAAHKHDFTTAQQLATEAKLQGELGYKQAMEQQQPQEFPTYLQ